MRSVVLTTIGRRSGTAREVPLYALELDDRFIVIGSNGGKERAPPGSATCWQRRNARSAWDASVSSRPAHAKPRATSASGCGRRRSRHSRATRATQQRTSRRIPVIVLEPTGPSA